MGKRIEIFGTLFYYSKYSFWCGAKFWKFVKFKQSLNYNMSPKYKPLGSFRYQSQKTDPKGCMNMFAITVLVIILIMTVSYFFGWY